VAVAALIGALLFGGLSALGFSIDKRMDTDGVTTAATVTDVKGDRVTVRFETEDERKVTSTFTWFPERKPTEGQRVDITYDRNDPSYVVAAGSGEDQAFATVFAAIAAYALAVSVGSGVGAVLIARARATRRAWQGTPWAAGA
jgi:hypothetical protein